MKISLRHQSLCDLTMLPTYCRAPEAHTRVMANEETEIVMHGLQPGTYGDSGISHIRFIEQAYSRLVNGTAEFALALDSQGDLTLSCRTQAPFLDP